MEKGINLLLLIIVCLSFASCIECGDSYSNSNYDYDDECWESVEMEKQLRDAGMDDAADLERKSRLNYMRGGGYTSSDGSRQRHYQGSQEQKRDLDMIDEYMRNNPDF